MLVCFYQSSILQLFNFVSFVHLGAPNQILFTFHMIHRMLLVVGTVVMMLKFHFQADKRFCQRRFISFSMYAATEAQSQAKLFLLATHINLQ